MFFTSGSFMEHCRRSSACFREIEARLFRSVRHFRIGLFHCNLPIALVNIAINGFTDSLRCELHHDKSNVKITAVHMPAMNTTQFGWVKNHMPNDTQPVPPIFEPELTAEVVVEAGLAKNPGENIGWEARPLWRS